MTGASAGHRRLLEQQEIWRRKPALRAIYESWFDLLLESLSAGARVLEAGAGPGFLAAHARKRRPDLKWVSSDILPVPWNDVAADALRLPLAPASVDAIVGLDFIHHLARPGDFFSEAARVLRRGGSVAVVEPWVTPLSSVVYGLFHEERFERRCSPWRPFGDRAKEAFEGNNALVWALAQRPEEEWHTLGLAAPRVRLLNSFGYLLSMGFSRMSLLPGPALPALQRLDDAARRLSSWTALRAHLVWEVRDALRGPATRVPSPATP